MDIVKMIRDGQLKAEAGAEIRVGSHRIRADDGTRFTAVPLGKRKQDRRRRTRAARKARR